MDERVLVVDDEEVVRGLFADMLSRRGYLPSVAESAERALSLIGVIDFSVALLDIRLPGMDGIELLEEIKRLSPDTEVIMMTGYASVETAVQALRKGAYDYITKPFANLEEIIFTVEKALKYRRLKLENRTLVSKLEAKLESVNSELYHTNRDLERRNKELSIINAIMSEVSRTLDLSSILDGALNRVLELMGAEAGAIALPGGEGWVWTAHRGPSAPLTSGDLRDDDPLLKGIETEGPTPLPGAPSGIRVPLRTRDRLYGAMFLLCRRDRTFGDDDVRVLSAIGGQIAVAMENASLFEAVSRAGAEWRNTFDSISDMIAVQDAKFQILRANREFARRFGTSYDDLLGRKCHELLCNSASPCSNCPCDESLKLGRAVVREMEYAALDGFFLSSASPILNSRREVVGVVYTIKDITEQRRLREKLAQAERFSAIGQLSASIAHEIRNPLGSIVTAANLLSSKGVEDNKDRDALLEVIKKESGRLNGILTNFLAFAKPPKLDPKPNDINLVVEEVLELLGGDESLARNIPIRRELDRRIPLVPFDRDKIKQVVWNVILNGIQAMPRGGELAISSTLVGDHIELRIRDSGEGIPEENIPKIFQPFFTTKRNGTGLGLSIANRIVEAHSGSMGVESRVGGGTAFSIRLPLGTGRGEGLGLHNDSG
ncbi:MAG: ATP-binding protein [bacterium]